MCGICGIYFHNEQKTVSESTVKNMCAAMRHRGPDDEGIFIRNNPKNIGFGMRRLSIIDLKTGHQPIFNEDKSACIVYNGEIYNFPELRENLIKQGHRFATNTDTEVIVHLYEQYGLDFVKKLNGMFAFALWDEKEKRLILARDIFGIKPLLYSQIPGGIVFASEINTLFASKLVGSEIDMESLDDYFSFYFTCAPNSIFKQIKKLPAAHMFVIKGNDRKLIRYWHPEYKPEKGKSEDYYSKKLEEMLFNAVKRHLISDVPLGVFLSGGLDSTTVVAMMQRSGAPSIKTYSIAFDEKEFNEAQDAKAVAQMYKTEHREIKVGPDLFINYLPRAIEHLGEPNGDWTSALELCLSEFAKKEVTVILSGTGGDEIFAGYPTITAGKFANIYRHNPALFRWIMRKLVHKLPVSMSNVSFDFVAKRFVEGAELEPLRAHMYWKEIFTKDERNRLYGSCVKTAVGNYDSYCVFLRHASEIPKDTNFTNLLLYIDTRTFLGDNILAHADASSMAVSIETRVPFLDRELVEFAQTVPPKLKHKLFTTKYLVRKTAARLLPKNIVSKKKMGFVAPVSKWLKKGLYKFSRDTVMNNKLMNSGILDKNYVQDVFSAHDKKLKDNGRKIQALVSFALWYNKYQ